MALRFYIGCLGNEIEGMLKAVVVLLRFHHLLTCSLVNLCVHIVGLLYLFIIQYSNTSYISVIILIRFWLVAKPVVDRSVDQTAKERKRHGNQWVRWRTFVSRITSARFLEDVNKVLDVRVTGSRTDQGRGTSYVLGPVDVSAKGINSGVEFSADLKRKWFSTIFHFRNFDDSVYQGR